jgi:hypothetical protein
MADKRISQLVERTDIANNDVLPIVASGATTTNKVTISTIQDWMQDNLDVGVTSVGITIGTSGTDVNVSGSPVTSSGNITINIPTASSTNRGLLSAADWTTFNNKQAAGNYVTTDTNQSITGFKSFANGFSLATAGGTNQATTFKNIGTIHEGSAGSNQIGFNNSNNIYFGKGLSNGGVIQWTNAAVRYYTLPDADGTLALASQLGAYLPLAGGTLTGALNGTSAVFSGDVQSGTRLIAAASSQSILLTPNSGGTTNRIESVGTLPLALVSAAAITMAAGGTTPQITLATSGNVGIGTSNPLLNLQINSVTGSNSTIAFSENNTLKYYTRYNAGDGSYQIIDVPNSSARLSIASTGAVTLTGALNGTSASFTTEVSARNGDISIGLDATYSLPYMALGFGGRSNSSNKIFAARDSTDGIYIHATTGRGIKFEVNAASTPSLEIASTGAATFSSSVRASSLNVNVDSFGTDVSVNSSVRIGSAFSNAASIVFGDAGTPYWSIGRPAGSGNFNIGSFSSSNAFNILVNGNVGIGTASPSEVLHIFKSTFPIFKIQSTSYISSLGIDTSSGTLVLNNESNAALGFNTNNTERMRITSSGQLLVNQTTATATTNGWMLSGSGSHYGFSISNNQAFVYNNNVTSVHYDLDFRTNNISRGFIRVNDTSVGYVTSSDYRLKEDLQEIKGLEKVSALKVYDFKWKDSEDRTDGVLAHELAEVLPYAVTGEKDAVDEDGNDRMQGVDYSKIVPVLIKAIQELKAEIDSLKTK